MNGVGQPGRDRGLGSDSLGLVVIEPARVTKPGAVGLDLVETRHDRVDRVVVARVVRRVQMVAGIDLLEIGGLVDRFPVWPFDVNTLRMFFSSYLLPILSTLLLLVITEVLSRL